MRINGHPCLVIYDNLEKYHQINFLDYWFADINLLEIVEQINYSSFKVFISLCENG